MVARAAGIQPSEEQGFLSAGRVGAWRTSKSSGASLAERMDSRGSYGRGAAFSEANVKNFGGSDLRDLLAGVVIANWQSYYG